MGVAHWSPNKDELKWAEWGVRLQHESLPLEEFLQHQGIVIATLHSEIRFIRNINHNMLEEMANLKQRIRELENGHTNPQE